MTRPRLLDLFCGPGGAGEGYHQAGFEVIGVDHVLQRRNPHRIPPAYTRHIGRQLLAHLAEPAQVAA